VRSARRWPSDSLRAGQAASLPRGCRCRSRWRRGRCGRLCAHTLLSGLSRGRLRRRCVTRPRWPMSGTTPRSSWRRSEDAANSTATTSCRRATTGGSASDCAPRPRATRRRSRGVIRCIATATSTAPRGVARYGRAAPTSTARRILCLIMMCDRGRHTDKQHQQEHRSSRDDENIFLRPEVRLRPRLAHRRHAHLGRAGHTSGGHPGEGARWAINPGCA